MMHSHRRKLVRSPGFTISDNFDPEPLRVEDEARMLAEYWAGVFQKVEPRIPSSPLEDYIVPLPWHTVQMEPEDFEEAVNRATNSTPGPDGISYGHIKCIAAHVGRLMSKICEELMVGSTLPTPLTPSTSTKQEASVVTAMDTRPIVIDNVITKMIPGALAAKLAPVFARLGYSCQYGFVRGRTIPQALMKLEEL
eukprot:4258112-Amphidinium_carterae.1